MAEGEKGKLSKQDLRILQQIKAKGPMDLTDEQKENMVVNQLIVRRLMGALEELDLPENDSATSDTDTEETDFDERRAA